MECDHCDAGNVVRQAIYLGEYLGDTTDDREPYHTTTDTWAERGNVLTYDVESANPDTVDEHEVWTWDEHDRLMASAYWTDDEAEHDTSITNWDDEHCRAQTRTHEDLVDESASCIAVYTYRGGWPWSGTGVSTIADGVTADNTFAFTDACPCAKGRAPRGGAGTLLRRPAPTNWPPPGLRRRKMARAMDGEGAPATSSAGSPGTCPTRHAGRTASS